MKFPHPSSLGLACLLLALSTHAQARISLTDLQNRIIDLEAADLDDGRQLIVDGVLADTLDAGAVVTVLGVNLDNGALPLVSLGGIDLSNVVVAADGLSLTATLPQAFTTGSYNLTVQSGLARTQFDAAMMSFQVPGPQGEQGEVGPAGPRGPAGPDAQTLALVDSTLSISNGNSVDLSGISADDDPANELNTALSFDGTNLSVTDAGGSLSADLSSLNDNPAEILSKLQTVDGDASGLDADTVDGLEGVALDARLAVLEGADQDAAGGQLIIYSVYMPSTSQNAGVVIEGVNFDNGDPPIVKVGGIELTGVFHGPDAIIGNLAQDYNDFSYQVTVQTGTARTQFDAAMATVQLPGPQGEQGPQGPQGEQGPAGPDDQTLALNSTQLSIENGNSIDLAPLFNDNDPANELNTSLSFDGSDLSITDAGGTLSTDLSSLSDTPAEVLSKLRTVDGANSGLDADLLDDLEANEIIAASSDERRTQISALPYTIDQPGSYVLTGDLVQPADQSHRDGIIIRANNVSLDLNGFALLGSEATFLVPDPALEPTQSTGLQAYGISVEADVSGLQVSNGTIANWPGIGIDAFRTDNSIFERLRIINNGGDGLTAGNNAVISQVTAYFNDSDGIDGDKGTLITQCTSYQNGLRGISVGDGSQVSQSTVYNNFDDGIDAVSGAALIQVTVYDNRNHGIDLGAGGTVQNSSIRGNGCHGIDGAGRNLIRDNVITENGGGNGSSCLGEPGHGIRISADGLVLNNQVSDNFGSGIVLAGSDALAEGNLVTGNVADGISVALAGSLVVRNRATENATDFNLPVDGAHGPVVDTSAGGNLSLYGNADHPLVNLSY